MARYFYQLTAQNPTASDLFQFETAAGLPRVVSLAGLAGQIANSMSSGDITSALGYTPIQQGGGSGQGGNKVRIGWDSSNSRIKAQVDSTDLGGFVMDSRSISAGNGLSGGGTLAANRTISLGTPGTLSGSTTNSVSSSSHTHALSANLKAWDSHSPDTAMVFRESLGGSVNLNNITQDGIYYQNANANASSGTNYPANSAGWLEVYDTGGMTYQRYTIYNSGVTYVRSRYQSTWYPWRELISSPNNNLYVAGHIHANGGDFTGRSNVVTLAPVGAGIVYLRPNGNGSSSGQVTVDSGGTLRLSSGVRLSNASGSTLQVDTSYGYLRAGPANSNWCHFHTDRPKFYFGSTVAVSGDIEFYQGPRVPRTFVQSGDPGSSASTGDLWIW